MNRVFTKNLSGNFHLRIDLNEGAMQVSWKTALQDKSLVHGIINASRKGASVQHACLYNGCTLKTLFLS